MRRLELKIPPVLCFLLMGGLMWLVMRRFPAADFQLPGQRWLATISVATGLIIAAAGVVSFRRARTTIDPMKPYTTSALVTSGIFNYTRNPMYLGLILVALGWGLWLGNAFALLGIPTCLAYLTRFQIIPEERALASLYREEFRSYCTRVRRWI